jgi:hypothetical protein
MFIIGGNPGVCPRGFICINNYNLLLILTIVIVGVYLFNKYNYLSIYNNILENKLMKEDSHLLEQIINSSTTPPNLLLNNGDNQNTINNNALISSNNQNHPTRNTDIIDMDQVRLNNRLLPPLSRNQYVDPNGLVEVSNQPRQRQQQRMAMPINIETRGSGGDFQQVGILSKNEIMEDAKTPGNNTDSSILPLYGKPIHRGASKWLYYTETDKFNPIKVPISLNGRDCTDDNGCDELYDGSEVSIPSYNGNFKVKIYKFNKPRYIPFI